AGDAEEGRPALTPCETDAEILAAAGGGEIRTERVGAAWVRLETVDVLEIMAEFVVDHVPVEAIELENVQLPDPGVEQRGGAGGRETHVHLRRHGPRQTAGVGADH